jgi:hypothetical protein
MNLQAELINSQVIAFLNTTLRFYASAKAQISNSVGGWEYSYGVKFLYRVGFSAIAHIILYGDWTTKIWYPFKTQDIDIYGPVVVSSTPAETKRGLDSVLLPEALPSPIFDIPHPALSLIDCAQEELAYNETVQLLRRQSSDNKFKYGNFECTTSAGIRSSPESLSLGQRGLPVMRSIGEEKHRSRLQKRVPTDCPKYYRNFIVSSCRLPPSWSRPPSLALPPIGLLTRFSFATNQTAVWSSLPTKPCSSLVHSEVAYLCRCLACAPRSRPIWTTGEARRALEVPISAGY